MAAGNSSQREQSGQQRRLIGMLSLSFSIFLVYELLSIYPEAIKSGCRAPLVFYPVYSLIIRNHVHEFHGS